MRRFPSIALAAACVALGGLWAYVEFYGGAKLPEVTREEVAARTSANNRGLDKISDMGRRQDAQWILSRSSSRGKVLHPKVEKLGEVTKFSPPGNDPRIVAAKRLNDLLADLPSMETKARDQAIRDLVKELRAAGPPGTQALIEFLRSGRDFPLREGYTLANNRLQLAPTLRLALLDAALDFEGMTPALLEVLREPKSTGEVEFAVRNLEQRFPGVYRQEALAALEKSLTETKSDDFDPHQAYFFGAIQHFRATELLPAAERRLMNGGASLTAPYAQALAVFPVEVRRPALARLFADPKVVEYLVEEARGVNDLDYADPELGTQVVQLFASQLDARQKSNFLQAFNGSPRLAGSANFFQPTSQNGAVDAPKIADALPDLKGRKTVLAQLAPHAATPELQKELNEAKRSVTAEIAWRETAARGDQRLTESKEVPIGNGVGNAVIQGKRIQSLELAPQ